MEKEEEIPMSVADLDLSATYTYADYLKWTFEERLELIKGKIFTMSAPNANHQRILGSIYIIIAPFLKGKACEVFLAPFDVRLPRKLKNDGDVITVVQPDVCVVCDPDKIDEKGCIGAPDIVVEILSPWNNKKELQNKYEVYEETGVKEYWIISPQDKTFSRYTLNAENKFEPSKILTSGSIVTTPVLPGLEISLEEIFYSVVSY